MGRPGVGNPGNSGGKKGKSGRKNYYTEKANAELLEEIFFNELDKEEVKKKLESGKYSLKDVFISKAFAGNERFLGEIFKKLFPDKLDVTGNVKAIPLGEQTNKKIETLYARTDAGKDKKAKRAKKGGEVTSDKT